MGAPWLRAGSLIRVTDTHAIPTLGTGSGLRLRVRSIVPRVRGWVDVSWTLARIDRGGRDVRERVKDLAAPCKEEIGEG